MIAASAIGFLLSDGEMRRIGWVQAMRRCLLRINGAVRYEQPPLDELLERIDLRATPQERELTRLLHACAARIRGGETAGLQVLFAGECAKHPGYGVLCREDSAAFDAVLSELGRTRLSEQISVIDGADERLRAREEELRGICRKRAHLFRAMGMAAGAALFLILI
ncbi:MAG: stage III sporulation protein AB [Clostridia bacterium]|nr:stage III sporulation protein AB [Clostridia bacterium]